MFQGALENGFADSFEAPSSLTQLFVIDWMVLSQKLWEVFESVLLYQGLQLVLGGQGVEGFEGNIDCGIDFHGKYFIDHH